MDEKTLDLAIEVATKKHEEELKRIEGFNDRANKLMGYAATLGALFFNLVSSKIEIDSCIRSTTIILFIIELFVIILCLLVSNYLSVNKYKSVIGGDILDIKAKSLDKIEFKKLILESYIEASKYNYSQNKKNQTKMQIAAILFTIGFFWGFIVFFNLYL